MNTFNLTFRGSVLPGYDPEKVKVAFAQYFDIDEQQRIDALFAGVPTVLRDGLDRKTAAALYVEIHKMGLDVVLEKAAAAPSEQALEESPPTADEPRPLGMDHEIREAAPGRIDMSWPVSRARTAPGVEKNETSASPESTRPANAQASKLAQQKLQLQKQAEELELARQAKRDADALAAIEKAEEDARLAQHKQAQQAALERGKAEQKAARLAAKREADKTAAEAKAQRREARALASEQAAQRRAEKNQKKREEAAEKARIRAQEKQRKTEQAAAAKQAKAAENKRRAEQKQEAKLRAAREAQALKAEKQAARQKADEDARVQREERERSKEAAAAQAREEHERKLSSKRQQSEENARQRKSQLLEKRQETERLAAEKAERKRKHAEEFAVLAQRKAAERARREALERAAREKAAREALEIEALQAEQRRLEAEEAARMEAEKLISLESLDAAPEKASAQPQATAPEPQAAKKGAESKPAAKQDQPAAAVNDLSPPPQAALRPRGKAGAGAPNMYQLRPFRNSLLVRGRPAQSSQIALTAFMVSLVALVALLALTLRFVAVDPIPAPKTAHALASNGKGELYLFVADQVLVHDRAGVARDSFGIEELGLQQLSRPMAFLENDHLIVHALATNRDDREPESNQWSLFNCDLAAKRCATAALPAQVTSIDAMALEPRTGVRYIASASAAQLFKVSANGELLAATDIKIPARPTLQLNSGLIYLGSADAPAISVLRPDDQAFGQQLDEILLVPEPAVAQQHTRVGDLLWSTDHWWAVLYNPETLDSGVYRFDNQWNFTGQLALARDTQVQALLAWSDKVLILDSDNQQIQRFNSTGAAEQPLHSESLGNYITERSDASEFSNTLWHTSLGLLAIVFLGALGFAYLHRLRTLVYRTAHETGAPPLNEREDLIQWIEPASTGSIDPRVLAMAYLGFSLTILLLSIALMVSPLILLAILVLLSGPPIAYLFLLTSPQGHIGTLLGQLLLVDHQSVYHLGEGARIRSRSQFLMIDDVVVYTGATLWPVFNPTQMRKHVAPLVAAGVKVDITTLAIKLLEAWHPIAKAVLIIVGSTLGAGLIAATAWL